MPTADEPAVEPGPPVAAPVEAADDEATARDAVDGSPEEDALAIPLLGDEVWALQEVVEQIGVVYGLASQLLAEFVAFDVLAILLAVREVERDLGSVPFELAALEVLFYLPVIRQVGVGVEIDDRCLDCVGNRLHRNSPAPHDAGGVMRSEGNLAYVPQKIIYYISLLSILPNMALARCIRRFPGHLSENMTRGLIPEPLPRTPVEIHRCLGRLHLSHMRERLALGEELPDQAVEVIIATALLRAVHVGEVDLALEQLLDRLVMAELDAVVERDRVDGESSQRDLHDVCDSAGMQGIYLPDDHKAGGAVVERQQTMAGIILGAMHQVTLPVSDAPSLVGDERPLADVPLMRMPEILLSAVGEAWTAFEAKICLPALPATVDPRIDRFVTHRPRISGPSHVASNLLGREMTLQEPFEIHLHLDVVIDDDLRGFRSFATPQHPIVSKFLVIDFVDRVALDLTTNGRAVLPEDAGDRGTRAFLPLHAADDFPFGK